MNIPQILENEAKFIGELEVTKQQKSKLWLSLYRILTLDSQLYSILHASTAITPNGNAVAFGDGIDCLGKSTASVITAFYSKKYIMDETTLYNQATGNVYGNRYRGIHIRADMLPAMEKLYNQKFYKPEDKQLGNILPEAIGLEVVPSARLKAIVCPHPNSDENRIIEETNNLIKRRKISITVNAHHLKLQQSNLDRINTDGGENPDKVEIIDYTAGLAIPEGLLSVPYYDLFYQTPEQLINLLERANL